jgi:transcriptional regulator GlxA family with amidase domain
MKILFVLYEGMTALDAVGPYEVLARLPGAEVHFVGAARGPVGTDAGIRLVVDSTFDDHPTTDLVLVPGTAQLRLVTERSVLHEWLSGLQTTWTTSVCTGSLALGAAGLLDGRRATTHWAALDRLSRYGAVPVAERVVFDGNTATAAGVSAGIDFALTLAGRLAGDLVGQGIQLGIEYDPRPPYSIADAPAELVELVRSAAVVA